MKLTKIFTTIFIVTLLAFTLNSCKKCKGEDPQARITNNGTKDASVQIKTSGGNTVNINNVATGTSSAYDNFAEGDVTFTIVIDKIEYVKTVTMSKCFQYDIVIDSNNNLTSVPVDRNA